MSEYAGCLLQFWFPLRCYDSVTIYDECCFAHIVDHKDVSNFLLWCKPKGLPKQKWRTLWLRVLLMQEALANLAATKHDLEAAAGGPIPVRLVF